MYTVIIVKTAVPKTPNNWAVILIQMLLLNGHHDLSFFGNLTIHTFHPELVLKTAEHNLYYTDKQPREYRQ